MFREHYIFSYTFTFLIVYLHRYMHASRHHVTIENMIMLVSGAYCSLLSPVSVFPCLSAAKSFRCNTTQSTSQFCPSFMGNKHLSHLPEVLKDVFLVPKYHPCAYQVVSQLTYYCLTNYLQLSNAK